MAPIFSGHHCLVCPVNPQSQHVRFLVPSPCKLRYYFWVAAICDPLPWTPLSGVPSIPTFPAERTFTFCLDCIYLFWPAAPQLKQDPENLSTSIGVSWRLVGSCRLGVILLLPNSRLRRANLVFRFCSLTATRTAPWRLAGPSLIIFLAIEFSEIPSTKIPINCLSTVDVVKDWPGQASSASFSSRSANNSTVSAVFCYVRLRTYIACWASVISANRVVNSLFKISHDTLSFCCEYL